MTRLKRFKIGLFTITLGMVLVGASFALADDKAVAEPRPFWRRLWPLQKMNQPHNRKNGSTPWRRLTVLVKYAVGNGR